MSNLHRARMPVPERQKSVDRAGGASPGLGARSRSPGQGSGACDEAPHAVLRPLMEREQCHVTRIRLSNNEYSTTSAPLRGQRRYAALRARPEEAGSYPAVCLPRANKKPGASRVPGFSFGVTPNSGQGYMSPCCLSYPSDQMNQTYVGSFTTPMSSSVCDTLPASTGLPG